MTLKIREAKSTDFGDLARLIFADEAWTRYGIDFLAASELINNAEDKFYLAQSEDGIIGFCTLRINGVGNIGAYLRMIVVAEAFRRQGIGKQLIDYIWQQTIQHTPNLFLICSTDNLRAQKFYHREGFRPVGELNGLVVPGHQEILFWKSAGLLGPYQLVVWLSMQDPKKY